MSKAPVSVIILTYNEEVNIRACLESVKDLTDEIFIVDSFSTDCTLEIAREYTDKIYQNAWVHWAHQRNWALDNLPLKTDWVLFLDADERLTPELRQEISTTLEAKKLEVQGFYIKRNFYFLGKWIKYGGYKKDYILRLIKKNQARSVGSGAREYVTISGITGKLQSYMIHEDNKDLSFWIDKHNKLANLEAQELLANKTGLVSNIPSGKKVTIEHGIIIWLREKIWIKMPLFIRPFFYFIYRYVLQLGFLDGKAGLIYCFLHGLWYPFLVDAKYYEIKKSMKK
jgi:glycosyltransferase involved in cell wall biosynthesis